MFLLSYAEVQTECPTVVKYWCGKPYIPKDKFQQFNQCATFDLISKESTGYHVNFSLINPSTIKLPPTREPIPLVPNLSNGYTATFRNQPYLSTDSFGSLVITVTNTTSAIVIRASLDDGTEILATTRINIEESVVEVPFSLAKIIPKLKAYDVKISFRTEDDGILVHITNSKLYHLPTGQFPIHHSGLTQIFLKKSKF